MVSKKRKWPWVLGSGIVLLGVIAASFPYWFSYVLRPVARHFGVEYRDYLRLSNDRFALSDVRGKIGTVAFSALRVEGFVPWKWKTRLTQNATNDAPPIFLTVNGWTLQVSPSNAGPSTNSPYGLLQLFERQVSQLNHWAPHALFSNGTFRWKNTEFASTTIVLQRGEVTGDITFPQGTASADFKADFSNSFTNSISVRVDSWDVRTRFRIVNRPEAASLTLTGLWKTNRVNGSVTLKPNEVLPEEAHLISDGITLPADVLKADGFESFTIKFTGDWQTNQFNTAIDVHAQPAEVSDKKRPGFDISASAHGNLNQATLDRARVFAPWLEANLEKPVTFDYKGNLEAFDVPFRMKADMNQQRWLPLQGFLEGVVRLNPGTIREPNLRFSLGGRQINGYGLEEATLKMSGQLRWPLLHIDEGSFSQTNGAAGTFTGQINLETREVSPSHFAFSGKVGDSLLPKGFDYQAAQISADVTGFWPKLQHSGTITITNLTYAALTNASVSAKWRGVYSDLESLETSLRSGTNQFQLSAALHILPGETNLTVQTLTWRGGSRLMLGASGPFEIDVGANTNSVNGQDHLPELRVKRLKIAGQGAIVSVDAAIAWPDRGQLQISATNLNGVIVAPLTARPIPEIHLPRLILTASWDHGPLQMDLSLLYSAAVRELGLVNSSLDFQADNTGLSVNGLNVSAASGTIFRAEGTLPVRIYPGEIQGKHLQISGSREVNFHAASAPNAKFWDALGRWTGIYIQDPVLKLDVTGKTKEPIGHLNLTASDIHTTRIKQTIPRLENIRLAATLNERMLDVEGFDFSVEQQFLHSSARVPLVENLWRRSQNQIFEYFTTNATVTLQGTNVQIAPFSHYFPTMLAPEGAASVSLAITPPLQLNGEITVEGLSTRPIESLGPVQEIAASIQLSNRMIRIKNFSGELAGESLGITGAVDWSEPLLATGFPGMNLRITGTNIPLARRPDLILRSDINLTVMHDAKTAPRISGAVDLRNSFFLSDLRFLVPGRLAKPRNRPPYFSIELKPFSTWAVDLRVRGDRFMKVRSPFFQGEVSSDFKITGTLLEPLALGDARINSGFIQFPFANLEVKQGLITLASDNPYLPTVFVNAGARAFGYELKMQVNGPADVPAIEFSSTPPLTSEEIVLMLTAGQLPRHELTFSTQQKAGTLALFLGKSLWAKFGSDEPGAERLTVRSGEDISDQGRQTYAVEYRLSKNWSLVGEYDRFSALNAGFKWRLYSR